MRLLFISLLDFSSFNDRNIYTDLLREFIKNGHEIYCVSPTERRTGIKTHLTGDGHILRLSIGNIQKTNIIEKGISTLLVETQFKQAIKTYFSDIKFDLVLYTTPPITFVSVVQYIKKRDNAKAYLMLKDIFPQNAVDLEMMRKTGVKGLLYRYFRRKEKRLYDISDKIGCMSPANVEYILKNNPQIDRAKVEVCPNAIEPIDMSVSSDERKLMREQYGIPLDKKVFVYGGNLGKPQGIQFLIDCLRRQKNNKDAFFLIVGGGTEYGKLESYIDTEKQSNVKLLSRIPKEDYDRMVAACDVGMIFLDHRFTIPNFPSRLLAYMQAKLPVLAVTDPNTDVGKIITEGGFGWWCESKDTSDFVKTVEMIMADNEPKGELAYDYLEKHYSVENDYKVIITSVFGKDMI